MLKYSVGIDISAKTFHCCISAIDALQKVSIKSNGKFDNSKAGFAKFESWIKRNHNQKEIPLVVVMEATGVYYENCALHLFSKGYSVSVILPNKSKKWMQADGQKSKNDKIDAAGLSKMGAEKSLELWGPAAEFYYQLRELTRQHQSLQEQKTVVTNQLHAAELGMYKNGIVISQHKRTIALIEKQLDDLIEAIEQHLSSDEQVAKKVENICAIKGVGTLTVAVILGETNGFALFESASQLVSYAGYDIIENESGKHVGKTRISKKGNSRIRRALFMPAFWVVKCEQKPFIDLYERTFEKHHIKMKSYVAVQKKLLTIMYALWKGDEAFDNEYQKNKKEKNVVSQNIDTMSKKITPTEAGVTQGQQDIAVVASAQK